MTVYLRDQWGSTLPKGGYEIVGPVGEAYVHHYNSGIQPARTVDEAMARMRGAQQYHAVTQGWLPGPVASTRQATAVSDPAPHLHVKIVPMQRVALRAVSSERLNVYVAASSVDIIGLRDGFEVVGPQAARVAAEMVDDVPVGDSGDKHLVREPINHHVGAAAFPLDHAVPLLGGLAGPFPAAAIRVDDGANPQTIGEVMYADHRNTPLQWSHAPGRPTGAGASNCHCSNRAAA